MKKKKILYIISLVQKSMAFEWIGMGLRDHADITFVLLNHSDSPLENFLKDNGIKVKRIEFSDKKNYLTAFLKVILFMIFDRPDTVHAHLFDAQNIGLLASQILRIKQRIYTRHNSNYHHVYYPRGVKFDRWSNRLATHIISISQATDKTLLELEHVSSSKVVKIPHGFDLNVFTKVSYERIEYIREKWKIPKQYPVIGVISRHIEWKGIQFIIPAFQKFLKNNPASCLVLANATGPYHDTIVELLKSLPTDRVVLIPFEEDVAALYSVFDLYVHTPIDSMCEAFGQTYVEALAAGVPSVFTLSGIAEEFIVDGRNALVVDFKDAEGTYQALTRLAQDSELRTRLIENGRQDVFLQFGVEPMLISLKQLYDS